MASTQPTFVPRHPSLREGWRIQRRVIGALILRELHTRYGRENVGYVWLILEPMLLASIIGLIHARTVGVHTGDMQPVPLALVGYCNFMVFRTIFNRADGAVEHNLPLFYHNTIKPIDILIARALLEAAGVWVAFAILMGISIAFGVSTLPDKPLVVLAGMMLMAIFAFFASMVVCGITHENRALGRLVHPFTYIMMPLSGAFFSMQLMPAPLRRVFDWVPLVHIFEIIRYGWFHAAKPDYIEPFYLFGWVASAAVLGLLLLSVMRRRIHMP